MHLNSFFGVYGVRREQYSAHTKTHLATDSPQTHTCPHPLNHYKLIRVFYWLRPGGPSLISLVWNSPHSGTSLQVDVCLIILC